jgi:hypothetical protein
MKPKPKAKRKPRKQTSNALSRLAARALRCGGWLKPGEVMALAGSVLSQDETKGKR